MPPARQGLAQHEQVSGDPQLLAIGGGLAVKKDVAGIGGIGVGGLPTGEADEEISNAGLKALNL